LIGLVMGSATTMAISRFVASFLHGIKANDAWNPGMAAGILTVVPLLAGLLPARRASWTDPVKALREE